MGLFNALENKEHYPRRRKYEALEYQSQKKTSEDIWPNPFISQMRKLALSPLEREEMR